MDYATRAITWVAQTESRGNYGAQNKNLDGAGLSYGLLQRWSKTMAKRDPAFKALFLPPLPGASLAEKRSAWEKCWKDYMFAFWHGIRNLYFAEQLWEPKTQLMYRATLEVLQDNFLEKKGTAGGITYADPVKLREDVQEFYKEVPAGFFHTEWKRKELLTSDGRDVLKDALNTMRVPGTKLKARINQDPLFTGKPVAGKKR